MATQLQVLVETDPETKLSDSGWCKPSFYHLVFSWNARS